jgi:hypothetical protein
MSRKRKNAAESTEATEATEAGSQGGIQTLLPPGTDMGSPTSVSGVDLFAEIATRNQHDRSVIHERLKENQQKEFALHAERQQMLTLLGTLGDTSAIPAAQIMAGKAPVSGKTKFASLGDAIAAAFLRSGGPMNISDLTAAVQALGYTSKSEDFRGIVAQKLISSKDRFSKTSRGVYDLKNRDKEAKASSATVENKQLMLPELLDVEQDSSQRDDGRRGLREGSDTSKVLTILQKMGKDVTTSDIRAAVKAQHPKMKPGNFSSALQQLRGKMKDGKQLDPDGSRARVTGKPFDYRYTANV